jgi:hypothetical protein
MSVRAVPISRSPRAGAGAARPAGHVLAGLPIPSPPAGQRPRVRSVGV